MCCMGVQCGAAGAGHIFPQEAKNKERRPFFSGASPRIRALSNAGVTSMWAVGQINKFNFSVVFEAKQKARQLIKNTPELFMHFQVVLSDWVPVGMGFINGIKTEWSGFVLSLKTFFFSFELSKHLVFIGRCSNNFVCCHNG